MGRPPDAFHHVTIANGTSVSDGLDITPYTHIALVIPAAWTAAAIVFDHSLDAGATWSPVYDDAGTEVTIPSASVVANRTISVASPNPSNVFRPLRMIRLVSGTHAVPVNQGAARDVVIMVGD